MNSRGVPLVLLLSLSCVPICAQNLTGTWRLVHANEVRPNGEQIAVFGQKPRGLLMYDAKGYVSMQIELDGKTIDGLPVWSHFGKYKVDPAGGTVTHEIGGTTRKQERGGFVLLFVTLDGNRLTLGLLPEQVEGEARLRRLAWERIE